MAKVSFHEEKCCYHLHRKENVTTILARRRKSNTMNPHVLVVVVLCVLFQHSFFVPRTPTVVLFVDSFSNNFNLLTQNSMKKKISHSQERNLRCSSSSSDYNDIHDGNSNNNKDRISKELIEKIKREADIVSVIESYNIPQFQRLSVDRATSLCPFHKDTNPSLNIDNNKGLYKCFACGAGGDVFNFVREYECLAKHGGNNINGGSVGGDKKMSYPSAITKVVMDHCSTDTKELVGHFLHSKSKSTHSRISPEMKLKIEKQNKKKERIILANSAAADFYARLLITSPKAGGARSHLFQRHVTPSQVRTFGLGYAPDAYFYSTRRMEGSWGKGSLVERLEELGFQPKEIVESGLAVVTSAAKNRLTSYRSMELKGEQKNTNVVNSTKALLNEKGKSNEGKLRYTDLMDRFRGRLMVPIFDATGKYVLGFGGRDLDENLRNGTEKVYHIPKYLNSPESLVFEKKNLLFGLHRAQVALLDKNKVKRQKKTDDKDSGVQSISSDKASIVIVEGYFDAISLYGAGVLEVASSMGAALTSRQLEKAADIVGQGRIVICLDNDDAGIGATERICSGSSLWKLVEKRGVEVYVGTLPEGVKDPAEFVEMRMKDKSANVVECFETEVLKNAVLWTEWFIDNWISKYDPHDQSSFARICDVITTFLSNNRNPADRTKQAFEAAGKLATKISGKNETGPLHIQLESDLLGMAAKKASKKEALEVRVEAVERLAQNNAKGSKITNTLNKNPTKRPTIPPNHSVKKNIQKENTSGDVKLSGKRQVYQKQSRPITQHFSGFRFNPSDAAWLGVSNQGSKVDLVLDGDTPSWKKKKKSYTYFNSNKYLGYDGGISTPPKCDDGEMIAAQINDMLTQNADKLQLGAEFRLLKTMVNFSSARIAMKQALENRIDNGPTFEWSTLEREWLFHTLTESPGHEPLPKELQEGGTVLQLQSYLQTRMDVPDGAFAMNKAGDEEGKTLNTDANTWFDSAAVDDYIDGQSSRQKNKSGKEGCLDVFFIEADDVTNSTLNKYSVSHDERAELTVQESVATLLKASAQKKLSQIKNDWKIASDTLTKRRAKGEEPSSETRGLQVSPIHDNLDDEELEILCKNLGDEVLNAIDTLRELTESSKQLGRRLLDYCSVDGTEGRVSKVKQEELAKMVEDHIANLPDDRDRPGYSDDYVFGSDEFRNDNFDPRYGGSSKQPIEKSIFEGDDSIFESIFE